MLLKLFMHILICGAEFDTTPPAAIIPMPLPGASTCLREEAIENCQVKAENTTVINKNDDVDVSIRRRSVQDCRDQCNIATPAVIAKFLTGCTADLKKSIAATMKQVQDQCGAYTRAATSAPETPVMAAAASVVTVEDQTRDGSLLRCARDGWCQPGETSILPNGDTVGQYSLSHGLVYAQHTRSDNGHQFAYFLGAGGQRFDTYQEAAASLAVSNVAPGSVKAPQGIPGLEGRHDPAPRTAEGNAMGEDDSPVVLTGPAGGPPAEDLATSPRPPSRPEDRNPSPAPEATPNPTTTSTQPVARQNTQPVTPQPLAQLASAPGGILESALNSPPNSSEVTSGTRVASMDSYSMSEASSGGGSGGGGGIPYSGSGYNPISANNNMGVDPQTAATASAPSPSMGMPMGGGGGASAMAFPSGGRGPGASRDRAAAPVGTGFRIESFRYDSFYKGAGGGTAVAAARTRVVPVDPNCRPSRTKRCAMRRVPMVGGNSSQQIADAQCDGKPECILRLTGKLRMPRPAGVAGRYGDSNESSATSERGIASVPQAGGVWRGYKNILVHIDNLGKDYLRLDHEGFLITDEPAQ